MRSCRAAVARVVVWRISLDLRPPSDDTGAYCRARARLSEAAMVTVTTHLATNCERQCPNEWLWLGHHVQIVDGTILSMPDTDENKEVIADRSKASAFR